MSKFTASKARSWRLEGASGKHIIWQVTWGSSSSARNNRRSQQRNISSEEYERLLFQSRDGVVARSRNLQACRKHERAVAAHSAINAPKSLFKKPLELKIGALQFFPDGLRRFCRNSNDGLVLDDVCDLKFIVDNQDKLQGKYDCLVEFGSTAGGTCAYHLDLYGVSVVVTINFSTKNLQYLESHD